MKTTAFDITVTDTFSGEANYSWVHRYVFEVPENATCLSIVRAAKKKMGWTGIRCVTDMYGDVIELRPRSACLVASITPQYPPQEQLP
jgi:hypothetical protein